METNKGVKLIASALGMFSKIIEKLEKGINLCQNRVDENNIEISDLNAENSQLKFEMEKAEKALKNIKILLGE